jgi:hypothetical protein
MIKAFAFSALAVFAAFALSWAAPSYSQAPDLAIQATVRLESKRGLCSGTVIAPEVVLTAKHCIGADDVVIRGGVKYTIHGRTALKGVDAMVVYAAGIACPCAPIADADMKAEARALGWPRGKWGDTKGPLVGLTPASAIFPEEEGSYLMHTVEIAPGSSGGGLWQYRDGRWVLVGVNVALLEYMGMFAYGAAVPADHLIPLVGAY